MDRDFGYDPEAIYQDADIEMRQAAEDADELRHEVAARLAAKGIQAGPGDKVWWEMEEQVAREWWG